MSPESWILARLGLKTRTGDDQSRRVYRASDGAPDCRPDHMAPNRRVKRRRSFAPTRCLSRWHARLQLLQPILYDYDFCCGHGEFLAGLYHHKATSVWRNVIASTRG